MTTNTTRILMLDVETLGKGPNAVVWQTALYAVDSIDPETLLDYPHFQYVPIQPQLDLLPERKVDASTLMFWFDQVAGNPEMARLFHECDSVDTDELFAVLRHFLRAYDRYTDGGRLPHELWTRGNFDVPIMESLLRQSGLPVPWANDFRVIRDLRTLEAASGVSYKDVTQPQGFIKHRADWDAIFQLSHWAACQKALGTGKA